MNLDEQRVRELAYQIWESEGCPEGQAQRHWEMALSLAEAEQAAGRDEHLAQRHAGELDPEKPALLQPLPRHQGELPPAHPERPDQSS